MGIIMRNGIPYVGGSGGDDAFRYVNDVNDENFGWIQYQLEDGSWVNYEQVETLTYPLYMSSANEGGFEAYAGGVVHTGVPRLLPTITFGSTMDISLTQPSGSNLSAGSSISELTDLTNYNTIKFHHVSDGSEANINRIVTFFISQTKENLMTPIVSEQLLYNQVSNSGDVEIDISAISGEYYIGFELIALTTGNTTQTSISNMYME